MTKVIGLCILVFIFGFSIMSWAPRNFKPGTIVVVEKNSSLSSIANELAKKHVIASPLIFKVVTRILHGQKTIQAGEYLFEEPLNVWQVIIRMVRGDYGIERVKVTIPEGATVKDIAWLILKKVPNFDAPYFVKIARDYEGYLFPDTYFFYVNVTPDQVLATLQDSFKTKLQSLLLGASLSGRKVEDIVTMASIIEKEASSTEDREVIAGILWKRLDEDMLLQVDAPINYATNDLTGYVSIKDTKIDSPYNTYKNKGLPIGPISNPGLSALKATINFTKTPYYYYLSDRKGGLHFATTFDGHQENREKYLK